jgi:uncharacterized protein YdaU (DUF1376 family)
MTAGWRWHARDHKEALDGVLGLSLEERGAFTTVLDLIYERGGPVPDDARWLAGWMGCSVKKWQPLRARLLDAGKLYVTAEGLLSNRRAEAELARAEELRGKLADNAATARRKLAEKRAGASKNNDLGSKPERDSTETETETGQKVVVVVEGAGEGARDLDPAPALNSPPVILGRSERSERRSEDPAAPTSDAARPRTGCAAGSSGSRLAPSPEDDGISRAVSLREGADDWPPGPTPDHAAALSALAGPGLADPAATPNLILSQPEVGRWRAAGCSWGLDVVPTVKALTARPRADRVQSWSYFTAAVLDRAARRRAPLAVPLAVPVLPESPAHAHPRSSKRAAREDNLGRALHAALAVAGARGG